MTGIPGEPARRNFDRVKRTQTDGDDHPGSAARTRENVHSHYAEEQESDRHPARRLSTSTDIAVMGHCRLMNVNALSREDQTSHVQRNRISENVEPSRSHKKIIAGYDRRLSARAVTPRS